MVQGGRKLLSTEREDLIVKCVSEGIKTVGELVMKLNVSEATVRRDLENLEQQGLLQRVHGGAELSRFPHREPLFNEKAGIKPEQKTHIASLAADFVNDSETVFIDGGSTLLELAKRLAAQKRRLTIVTNSLMAASELMESECRLVIVGGEFRAISRTLVGPLTECTLGALHIDKAFLGTIGFTLEHGLTTTDVNEAYTKKLAAKAAEKVFILVDSSKIGVDSFVSSGDLADIDVVVTDSGISPAFVRELKKRKIEVVY